MPSSFVTATFTTYIFGQGGTAWKVARKHTYGRPGSLRWHFESRSSRGRRSRKRKLSLIHERTNEKKNNPHATSTRIERRCGSGFPHRTKSLRTMPSFLSPLFSFETVLCNNTTNFHSFDLLECVPLDVESDVTGNAVVDSSVDTPPRVAMTRSTDCVT